MARRLYWLKLKDDFFSRLEIKRLRKMPGGDTLVLVYQRLLLLSLRSEGVLTFQGYERDLAEELALELDEEIDSVRAVLLYMQRHELIQEIGPNEYQLAHVLEATGSESESAERVRRYRERRAELPAPAEEAPEAGKPLPGAGVTLRGNAGALHCNTEKEKEKEIEQDPEIERETESDDQQPAAAGGGKTVKAEVVTVCEQRFMEFWKLYPKKVGKKAALNSWKRLKPDAALFDQIMAAVEAARASDQWRRENGRFIPNPATWINQGRWDDELPNVAATATRGDGGKFDTMAVIKEIMAEEESDPFAGFMESGAE